ncbi:MAG: hypothetical protein ACRYGK_14755 [Janthinobacterium lividum]
MAFVTITEAAKLVRRSRRTLYRDIDAGRLSKTVNADGGATIDTAELLRAYGSLHMEESGARASVQDAAGSEVDDFGDLVDRWDNAPRPLPKAHANNDERVQVVILEEKIKSLQHILEIEATLRKVKDEVTTELRSRLEEKDRVIKTLENRVLLLDYDGPQAQHLPAKPAGFFARLFQKS